MTDPAAKTVELNRLRRARYVASNDRGGTLEMGEGDDAAFTPVELLLAAIAGCTAYDVDYITSKRAEPVRMDVRMSASKVRDRDGNHLVDLVVTFDPEFPEGEAGDAAREVLPGAVQRSHDRLCTVSRTVELGTPVTPRIVTRTAPQPETLA